MRALAFPLRAVLAGLAVLSVLSAPLAAAPTIVQIPTGELVASVPAKAFPGQSYALYLPASYSPDRAYPALFLFDARRGGAAAAKRFVPAAEAYGWIVVSSNNSESDGSMDVNLAAMKAMHEDALGRFAIDRGRLYAGGFSGGARAACLMAIVYPEEVRGVIGAGGGFPFDRLPSKATSFAFFASAGDKDFNWYELHGLDATLASLGLPHRLATFDGVHQWPPEAVATQAIEWFELRPMKEGRRGKDAALLAQWLGARADRARTLEADGTAAGRADAYLAWSEVAEDFAGLADTTEAAARAKALGAEAGVRAELAERTARDRRDRDSIERARLTLAAVPPEEASGSLGRLLVALRVKELQKKAAGTDRAEALSAERLLAQLQVQTGFYLPRALMEKKDWARAALFLEIATTIRPKNYDAWYTLAQARAQGGNHKRAVEALLRAVEEGFDDRPAVEGDPLLAPLRAEPGFRAAIESVGKSLKHSSGSSG
ncbi:MAG TPA: tetratricopeptide repeat protein [Thermoanaerobaculia bacterium]|jgi:predicted esterase|nr:tetratricopeptide repeat protein [Thermoanaerobaculia bacterium]